MFSVPSPFAGAAVIGKPGVLLFQRPGSVEREVILGPWRRALEHGGGRWADKNQAWPRQEHADVHTHRLSCTHIQYIHDMHSNVQMHIFDGDWLSLSSLVGLPNKNRNKCVHIVSHIHIYPYNPPHPDVKMP